MSDYKILTASNPAGLTTMVDEAIDDGYNCVGGISTTKGINTGHGTFMQYTQAVAKSELLTFSSPIVSSGKGFLHSWKWEHTIGMLLIAFVVLLACINGCENIGSLSMFDDREEIHEHEGE